MEWMRSFINGYACSYNSGCSGHPLRLCAPTHDLITKSVPVPKPVPRSVGAYGTSYRGATLSIFNFYLVSLYPEASGEMDWCIILSRYEKGDPFEAFYRLLRRYAEIWNSKKPKCA